MARSTPTPSEFFNLTATSEFDQGDIVADVPFVDFQFKAEQELIIIRGVNKEKLSDPEQPIRMYAESSVAVDAFTEDSELVVLRAERGLGMVLTPTCDLGKTSKWQVCILRPLDVDDSLRDRTMRFDIANRFPVLAHPGDYFDEGYIDLFEMQTVDRAAVKLKNRIARLAPEYQAELANHFSGLFGRLWGYGSADDRAPEEGYYRCIRCCHYHELKPDPQPPVQFVKKGDQFPPCANCQRIRKTPQYRFSGNTANNVAFAMGRSLDFKCSDGSKRTVNSAKGEARFSPPAETFPSELPQVEPVDGVEKPP